MSSGPKKPGKGSRKDPQAAPTREAESGTRAVEEKGEVDATWESLPPAPEEAPEGKPRAPMQTITNEVELEAARLRSIVTSAPPAPPPPPATSAPQHRVSLLSLANDNAPTIPPPRIDPTNLGSEPGKADGKPTAPPPPDVSVTPIVEMRERFSLGDYTGALQVAEAILEDDPDEDEARRCAEDCRAVLVKMYTARIGSLEKVPIVTVAKNQLRWLTIDHRAGFVLSHVDGCSTLEQILDVSGMPPLDALRILYELVQQRIIAFK